MMKHVRYLAIAMVCTGALVTFPAAQQDPARKPSTASGATMNQPAVPTTLVGKRVEITGHIDADPDHLTGAARDVTDLPELETASIREVSGTCPATPKL